MTESQKEALAWLFKHNGEGTFTGRGAEFLAAGETAPFTHRTWRHLRDDGYIEKIGKRQMLTGAGSQLAEKLILDGFGNSMVMGFEDDGY